MKKTYFLFVALLAATLSFAQGSEDFTNSTVGGSYSDGSFVGNNGVTWTYTQSRDAVINGGSLPASSQLPALMLRRLSSSSTVVSSPVTGGIQDFSVKLYKQFSGTGNRQVELFVNGTSYGTSVPFDDYLEHIFTVTGINVTGPVTIELKNITTKQVAVDDISWTPMGGGATVDTIATISTADLSVFENVGTVNVDITLNQTPALDKTIDLALISGNAAVIGNYTTQAVTFIGGGATTQTVTLNITSGLLGSASETFDFMIINPGADLVTGADTSFQLTVNQLPVGPSPCSELFFSEYIEGGGFNKAIEIYNPTMAIVDLSNYEIRKYSAGNGGSMTSVALTGMLSPGNVFVVAGTSSSIDPAITAVADMTSSVIGYNGDDAMELYNTSTTTSLDFIGDTLGDPGSSWPVGSGSTKDFTLVRMSTVGAPTSVWVGFGDTEWDVFPKDTTMYLGAHTNSTCALPPLNAVPIASSMTACLGDTITFTHTSLGGTAPYSATWGINGNTISGDTVIFAATASGPYVIILGIADAAAGTDSTSITVEFFDAPTVSVNIPNMSICEGDTSFYTGTSTGASPFIYDYSLFSSDAVVGFDTTSGDGYFTSLIPSLYDVNVMVTDTNGCSSSTIETITVLGVTDATFPLLADVCIGDTLNFTHTDATGAWSGTGVTDQTSGVGYFTNATAGTYAVTYTTGGVCPDSYTDTTEVLNAMDASFPIMADICNGDSIVLTHANPTGVWSGTGVTDYAGGTGVFINTPGTYNITYTIAGSCGDTFTDTVTIDPAADASFTISDICFGDTVILDHNDNTGTWSGMGVTDMAAGNGTFTNTAGTYDVIYTIVGACGDADTNAVEVFVAPVASFTATGTTLTNFTSTSTGTIATYDWDFGDGGSATGGTTTTTDHTYLTNGTYNVCLTVTTADGCVDTHCEDVVIQGLGINGQNAISFQMYPNPSNGMVNITTGNSTQITIVNLIGSVVYSDVINGTKAIDLNSLSKGSYFVRISQDGNTTTEKLIIK